MNMSVCTVAHGSTAPELCGRSPYPTIPHSARSGLYKPAAAYTMLQQHLQPCSGLYKPRSGFNNACKMCSLLPCAALLIAKHSTLTIFFKPFQALRTPCTLYSITTFSKQVKAGMRHSVHWCMPQ